VVAAPLKVDDPEVSFPGDPPYTVDTLFELPESNRRFEVLGGSLIVVPAPSPGHNWVLERLRRLFTSLLPTDLVLLDNTAVGLPNRDGPIPDLLVTTVDPFEHPRWLPAAVVHTVVEVVSPSNAVTDRVWKTELYAEAGIPCYWRVEQRLWKEHFGPVPAIVVRLRDKAGEWQQTIAAAGMETEPPVVVDAEGTIVTVKIDPATLVGKRSA
jgi:Uma2 family endonuclease